MSSKVTVLGRLTKDPKIEEKSKDGRDFKYCQLSIAANHSRNSEKTLFYSVTLWDRDAENAYQYLAKGSSVTVIGELTSNPYISKSKQAMPGLSIEYPILDYGRGGKSKKSGEEREVPKTSKKEYVKEVKKEQFKGLSDFSGDDCPF